MQGRELKNVVFLIDNISHIGTCIKIFEYCVNNKSVYVVKSFDVAIFIAVFIPILPPSLVRTRQVSSLRLMYLEGVACFLQTKQFAGGRC